MGSMMFGGWRGRKEKWVMGGGVCVWEWVSYKTNVNYDLIMSISSFFAVRL